MTTSAVPTPDEIWKILKEVSASQKKTAAAQEEAAARRKEADAKEAARQKEADAKEAARHEKAMQEMEEIRQSQRETAKQIKKTEALFNTQWGKLMESLVDGDLVPILNQRGIPVDHTVINAKKRGRDDNYEYDIIAVNGEEIVVVEVKTTLRVQDVKDFLVNLGKVTTRMSHYKHKTIYGAMAWLRADSNAEVYAERQGLFVIRATGGSASIINQEDFKPQVFT